MSIIIIVTCRVPASSEDRRRPAHANTGEDYGGLPSATSTTVPLKYSQPVIRDSHSCGTRLQHRTEVFVNGHPSRSRLNCVRVENRTRRRLEASSSLVYLFNCLSLAQKHRDASIQDTPKRYVRDKSGCSSFVGFFARETTSFPLPSEGIAPC